MNQGMSSTTRKVIWVYAIFWHISWGLLWLYLGVTFLGVTADLSRFPIFGSLLAATGLAQLYAFIGLLLTAVGLVNLATVVALVNQSTWDRAVAYVGAAITALILLVVMIVFPLGFTLIGPLLVVWAVLEAPIIYYFETPGRGRTEPEPERSVCPNCRWPGILPTMNVCPQCGFSLRSTLTALPPSPPPPSLPPTDVYPPPVSAQAWLIVTAGPGIGRRHDLSPDTTIGRDRDCHIRLDDGYVSRRHARVILDGKQYVIYDLGAKGGTFVNDKRVQKLLLYDGDVIRLGQTTLEFKKIAASR